MSWSQRRDAIRAVLTGVNLAAGPQEIGIENSQNGGHHPVAREARLLEITLDCTAQFREVRAKSNQSRELFSLARAHMTFVIEILPTAGRVLPHYLHATGRPGINGHVGPGRRDPQLLNAVEVFGPDSAAIRRPVFEAAAGCAASQNPGSVQPLYSSYCHGY